MNEITQYILFGAWLLPFNLRVLRDSGLIHTNRQTQLYKTENRGDSKSGMSSIHCYTEGAGAPNPVANNGDKFLS